MRRVGGRVEEDLLREFRAARSDPGLALLEGFHPLKHAIRFDAELIRLVTSDRGALARLSESLAPALPLSVIEKGETVSPELFARLTPITIPTAVLTIARRPKHSFSETNQEAGPLVLLEEPRDLSNVGAAVRVAAAAGVAGLLTTGPKDPWSPEALRTAAGLHYALPVLRIDSLPETDRALIAIDPAGEEELGTKPMPDGAILAFGTERDGLSPALLARATRTIRIPMRPGVSSLNLATSVAAVLYGGGFKR